MKPFATVNPSEAMRLSPFLKEQGIPFAARITTEETGLVAVELSADDSAFESACDAAETWLENEYQVAASKPSCSCPNCNSPHLQSVDDESSSAIIIRC